MNQLRGGGCISSVTKVDPQINNTATLSKSKIPEDFKGNIETHLNIIKSLSETSANKQSSIQYLIFREHYFNRLVEYPFEALDYIDFFAGCVQDLLISAKQFVKSNAFFSTMLLQITEWMAKISFWFYSNNSARWISQDEQLVVLKLIKDIDEQVSIEETVYESEISYQLSVIKMIYTIIPNDSTEGQEILFKFAKETLSSLISMKISDELLDCLKQGAQYALNEGVKIYFKNQYKAIFYIQDVKYRVIQQLENASVTEMLKLLSEAYENIKNKSWDIKYCWIRTIGEIISFRPIMQIDSQLRDQLIVNNSLIKVDDQYLVNISADKLSNPIEQSFINQNNIFRKIMTIQDRLINGTGSLPKFIEYTNFSQTAESENNNKNARLYFIKLFNNINLSQNIKQIKLINEELLLVQAQHLSGIESYQLLSEILSPCINKMNSLFQMFSDLLFINAQWQKMQIPTDQSKEALPLKMKTQLQEMSSIQVQFKNTYASIKKLSIYTQFLCEEFEQADEALTEFTSSEFLRQYQKVEMIPLKAFENLKTAFSKFESEKTEIQIIPIPQEYLRQVNLVVQYENQKAFEIEIYLNIIEEIRTFQEGLSNSQLKQLLNLIIYLQTHLVNCIQSNKGLQSEILKLLSSIKYQQLNDQDQLQKMKIRLKELLNPQSQIPKQPITQEQTLKYQKKQSQDQKTLSKNNLLQEEWTQQNQLSRSHQQERLQDDFNQIESFRPQKSTSNNLREDLNKSQEQVQEKSEVQLFKSKATFENDDQYLMEQQQNNSSQGMLYEQQKQFRLQNESQVEIFQQDDQLGENNEQSKQTSQVQIPKQSSETIKYPNQSEERLIQEQLKPTTDLAEQEKQSSIDLHQQQQKQLEATLNDEKGKLELNIYDQAQQIVSEQQQYLQEQYKVNKNSLTEKAYQQYLDDLNQLEQIQKQIAILQYLKTKRSSELEVYQKNILNYINNTLLVVKTQSNDSSKTDQLKKELNYYELYLQQYQQFYTYLRSKEINLKISQIAQEIEIITSIKVHSNDPQDWIKQLKSEILQLLDTTYQFKPLDLNFEDNFQINKQILSSVLERISPTKESISYKEQFVNILYVHSIHLKNCIVTQLFLIRNRFLKMNQVVNIDIVLLRMKALETNFKIQKILNSPEYSRDMNRILEQYWPSNQENIVAEIKGGIKILNTLLFELQQERNPQNKIVIQQQYAEKENQMQQCLQNVSSIGNSLGIQMLFIKDLKQDLIQIDKKLNDIQNSLNTINQDLAYLRGKTIYQLFEIRQMNVLQAQKVAEARSIYIKILCVEKKFLEGNQSKYKKPTNLFNMTQEDKNGELNEFQNQNKSSMLIHGPAGSGKSTASRKMEQYLWKNYEAQKQSGQRLTVPIVVQLPQLQDPEFQAITETLLSDNYMFDLNQIRELKQEIKKNKIQLFIIMDSYDELKKEFIGKNLIRTNKLSIWGTTENKYYPKIITTTRSEVLNQEHYEDWFLPEVETALEQYKEVRLEGFNKQQQDQYIEQYTILSLKLVLYDSYYHLTSTQNINQYLDIFHQLWNSLQVNYNKDEQDALLSEDQIKQIEQYIFSRAEVTIDNNQLKRDLIVNLRELKSVHFFSYCIDKVNIDYLLDTPFMMEIVVQVLPSLIRSKSSQTVVRQIFENNYQSNKTISKQDFDALWKQLVQSQIFFDRYSIISTQKDIFQLFNDCGIDIKYHDICFDLLQYQINSYDFYEIFFKTFFDKQLTKYKDQGQAFNYQSLVQELWDFATKLAIDLSKVNKTQVQYQQSGLLEKKKIQSWEDYYFDDDCKEGVYKKMFRSCIPIKHSAGNYSFNHKSLQEFLVAKDFMDRLVSLTEFKDDLKDKFLKHFANESDWSIDFLKGTCQFIVQQSQNLKKAQEHLVKLIQSNQDHKSDYIRLGSNCLFLILQIGPLLQGVDLCKIKITDTNLQGGNLAYCHLNQSEMDNVNISSINLFKSSLKQVIWKNTKTEEYPRISFKGKLIMTNNQKLIQIQDEQQYLQFEDKNQKILLFPDEKETYSYNIVNSNIYFYSSKQVIKINTDNYQKIVYDIGNVKYCQEFENKILFLQIHKEEDYFFTQFDMNTCQFATYKNFYQPIKQFIVINECQLIYESFRQYYLVVFDKELEYINSQRFTSTDRTLDRGYTFISLTKRVVYDGKQFFTWKLIDSTIELLQIKEFPKVDIIIEDQNTELLVGINITDIYLIGKSWKIKKSISHNLDYQCRCQYDDKNLYLDTTKQNYYLDSTLFILNIQTHVNLYNIEQLQLLRSFDLPSGLIKELFIYKRQFIIVQYETYYYYNGLKSQSLSNNNFQIQSILFLPNSLNFIVQQLPTLNLLYYNVKNLLKPTLIKEGDQKKYRLQTNSQGDVLACCYGEIVIWNGKSTTYSTQASNFCVKLTNKLEVYSIELNRPITIDKKGQLHYISIKLGDITAQDTIISYFFDTFRLVIYYEKFVVVVWYHNPTFITIRQLQAFYDQLIYCSADFYLTQSQAISTSEQDDTKILYNFYDQVIKVVESEFHDLIVVEQNSISILNKLNWTLRRRIQTNFVPDIRTFTVLFYEMIYACNQNKLVIYSLKNDEIMYTIDLPYKPQQIVEYYGNRIAILMNGQVYIYKEQEYECISKNHQGSQIQFKNDLFVSFEKDRIVYQTSESGEIIIYQKDCSEWIQPQIVICDRAVNRDSFARSEVIVLFGILNNKLVMLEVGKNNDETLDLNGDIAISQLELSDKFRVYLLLKRRIVIYQSLDKFEKIFCDSPVKYMKFSDDEKYLLICKESQVIDIYLTGTQFQYLLELKIDSKYYEDIVIFNEIQLIFIEQGLVIEYLFKEKTTEVIANLSKGYYSVGRTSKGFSVANKDGSIDMYTKMKYFDQVNKQYCENYVIFKTVNNSPAKSIQAYNTLIDESTITTEDGMDLKDLFKTVKLD